MGCATSKLDDSPAVALCRDRCASLDEAVRRRFAFAEAHAAYLHSLNAVGLSLDRFFSHDPLLAADSAPPLLNLPPRRKGSDSGSHLRFRSDSDSDDEENASANSESSSRQHDVTPPDHAGLNLNLNLNYMRNQTTPSVAHTQLPMSAETMQIDSHRNFFNGYSNYGGGGGFLGDSSAPAPSSASTSNNAPPPPPSPPRSSTWDFLNPFETVEKFYPAYTSSHDSREVREEEGIPDLEEDADDDDGDAVVVKLVDLAPPREQAPVKNDVDSKQNVNKSAVIAEKSSKNGFKDDFEVLKEIQFQFERASQCGKDLSEFLEVGKLPYKHKHVSSKILHLTAVSFQHESKASDNGEPAFIDVLQDVELKSKSLSSVLHKLHLWEKKLYEEVKVEEKMRVDHERRAKKMKHMDERGSESHKVEATRTLVRNLSTKMKVAIQVVDKISMKINRLRDEELWPQLHEFIQGLTRMWKMMLECHSNQCRAIGEAKRLDTIASQKHFTDAQFEATRQLQHDVVKWTLWFSRWVGALKGYVRALNSWLMKCLLYVPEETPDGVVPFSPGRMGAPAVFVVCNQWSQSMDRISEREVVDCMSEFASNVLWVWDRDKAEMRQKMVADRDERKLKSLDREDQKMQKEIQSLERKMVMMIPNDARVVYQSETSRGGGLQASLQRVLEAVGKFTSNALKVHEEILQRVEEDHRNKQVS
ncbi:protein ALTERED PHOSPHATE STARVATION RESPONSE 1-like [Salvia miltiorrhiza]|uniref:protein ALTERED PHOSPHATE STARVATION RESPONSE 1-like n=1 Tax=Salvia miltiorrhiza TaxID=226208 RepID=UPI0025ACE61A|nr:protein ALTERED PHOSPHATE STARVATION RESPONSE 1-like [Salvia miltiorrhiza]